MVGLIAVGVWEQFSSTDEKVALEASEVAAVYRDLNAYPEPDRSRLQTDVREYTRYVIDKAWPLQRKEIIPQEGTDILWKFQNHLTSFQPTTSSASIIHAETLRSFNHLVELRRMRLHNVATGLPTAAWVVLVFAAGLTMSVSCFFETRSFNRHFWMVAIPRRLLRRLISLLVGL